MILKESLRQVALTQKKDLNSFDYGVEREKLKQIDGDLPYAVVLSGIRRCGKSTLLRQLAKNVGKFYYFNFEDARVVGFEVADFQKLDDVLHEEYGECGYYLFDEVQNADKWELFVRAGLDRGKQFVLTGSNASLLSRELGTRLTGRHLRVELFPFSFNEALKLLGKRPSANAFQEYLQNGGFPDYLRYGRPDSLRELLSNVIERDIVVRHNLRDSRTIKEMAVYLLTNSSKEFSLNSLKKMFGLGSVTTVSSYVSFMEQSYLLFTVPKFDYSLKSQLMNPKKVYSIDTGFSNANSASFSEDLGRQLENSVFLHIRRKHNDIFYFRGKNECDFVVKEKNRVSAVYQVCYELTDDNKERELRGLLEALQEFKLAEGLLLTFDQEDSFVIDGKKIKAMPAWKWMAREK